MRRIKLVVNMKDGSLHINRNGDVTLSAVVEDSVGEWLESAVTNVTPSNFENFEGDEYGMNADGFMIAVYPEGV